jgi:hypothetical protein
MFLVLNGHLIYLSCVWFEVNPRTVTIKRFAKNENYKAKNTLTILNAVVNIIWKPIQPLYNLENFHFDNE